MSIKSELKSLANAIRSKTGGSELLTIPGMTNAVASLSIGSSIEFYECASYTPNADAYTKYTFTLSGATDEKANGTYVRTKYIENIGDDVEYMTASIWKNDNGYSFTEEYEYGNWRYYLKNSSGDYIYGLDSSMPRLTDFNSEYWADWNIWESVPLVFSAWQTEEVPATTEGWTGYKITQNTETGAWSKSDTLTEGLTVTHLKPKVGEIFSADTTIRVRKMYDGAVYPITSDGLVFYAPLQTDYVDMVSGKAATVTGGTFTTHNGLSCLQLDGSEYVKWADNADLPTGNGACSMVILAAPTNGSDWRTFMTVGDDSYCMDLSAKNGHFQEWGGEYITADGKWQSLIITRADTSAGTAYLNGKLNGSGSTHVDKDLPAPGWVCAGAEPRVSYGYKVQGYIAFAAVYNRELSAEEAAEIHTVLMEDVEQ